MNKLLIASRSHFRPRPTEEEGAPGPYTGPSPGSIPLDPSVAFSLVGSSPLASFQTAVDAPLRVGALRVAGRNNYSRAAPCPPAWSSKSHNPAHHALPPGTRPYLAAGPPPAEETVASDGAPNASLTLLPEGGGGR